MRGLIFALLFLPGARTKPVVTLAYCPCINVAPDGKTEYYCRRDTVAAADTAEYKNDYFTRHKTTGRAAWVPITTIPHEN